MVGVTAALWTFLAGPAAGEELTALAQQPLPLAIRDGRIARLTVHAVPFGIGAKEPAPATAAALDELVAGLATDCFLTAQAIGHVRPGTPGDGDTLAAHRLARARAEAVQAALTRGGLPAESVASVWDFQFTVREPRVTLWVFSLPQGDECEGKPLPGTKARIAVAELPRPDPAPPPPVAEELTAPESAEKMVSPGLLRTAVRDLEPAPGIHLPDPPPVAEPAVAAVASEPTMPAALVSDEPATLGPAPASPPAAVAAPSFPAQVSAPAQAEPPSTSAVAAAPEVAPEVVPPVGTAVLTEGPATPPVAAAEPVATAELVFEPNSSFFPRGAEAELKRLVAALPAGRGYEFEVQAAVDDKAGRDDPPEKALAYNQWLADRRQGRVAEWLEQHAEIRVLEIRRSVLEHDPSRRVVVHARPLP